LQYVNNPDIPPEVREQVRARLGLDRPPLEQYLQWLKNFFTGNLGLSYQHSRPVVDILLERAPRTIALFIGATLISFYTGFSFGKILAWRRGGLFEYGATVIGIIFYTIFTPWFGLLCIYFFGLRLGWLPLGKFLDPNLWRDAPADINANYVFNRLLLTALIYGVLLAAMYISTRKLSAAMRRSIRVGGFLLLSLATVGIWALSDIGYLARDMVEHLILPTFVITILNFAGTMLLTRNTMLETLREDYVMAARAKGLPDKVVRDKHAARNAFLPVFTSLIISLPFILSGGIITETIFSWPGMGQTLLEASLNEDIPLAMGALSFIGVLTLIAHLLADVMYAFLDPRIRYQ
jgi:peptide/nickel transport system permease protein